MPRMHLFEWEDFSWFPATLRDAATAYLRKSVEGAGYGKVLAGVVRGAVEESGAERVVDLCSGGAGPVVELAKALRQSGREVPVLLTDLYPNVAAMEQARRELAGAIDFVPEGIDATRVPASLQGLRTLFNSFHHFRPEQARRILADAVEARQPIAVLEIVNRDPATLLGIPFVPLFTFLLMPAIRPVRASWLFFTYALPLVPLLILWDGIVSCLRVYSPEELRELVESLPPNDYEWKIGRLPLGGPAKATYLVGRPPG